MHQFDVIETLRSFTMRTIQPRAMYLLSRKYYFIVLVLKLKQDNLSRNH